jgi:glycosyltransferase involved in cell wall biosynthesis
VSPSTTEPASAGSLKLAGRRIGFVSTRFSGTDGVSLEARKWAEVLERLGHTCYFCAGECDRGPDFSHIVPEAAFNHPAVEAVSMAAFSCRWGAPDMVEFTNPELDPAQAENMSDQIRPPALTRRVRELADHLKACLYEFAARCELELLIVENALSIPMNLPLGLALAEFIAETGIATIAHHHDFYWERKRFLSNCVSDYLDLAFPPQLPSVRHVVINSLAARQLSWRRGLSSTLIPNVMDFENPPPAPDGYSDGLRSTLGLEAGEALVLQPTRVVQRKGIEHAIELTRRLDRPARLVVSHASGDEGDEYEQRIHEFARLLGVKLTLIPDYVAGERGSSPDGHKLYRLGDIYPQADLVTYPSEDEGFGNAFLEAIYFRRPVVVNNYAVFDVDIKRHGFRVIEFDDYITEATLNQARRVLAKPELGVEMAETNYRLGERHYSFAVLERRLQTLIADLFGEA